MEKVIVKLEASSHGSGALDMLVVYLGEKELSRRFISAPDAAAVQKALGGEKKPTTPSERACFRRDLKKDLEEIGLTLSSISLGRGKDYTTNWWICFLKGHVVETVKIKLPDGMEPYSNEARAEIVIRLTDYLDSGGVG